MFEDTLSKKNSSFKDGAKLSSITDKKQLQQRLRELQSQKKAQLDKVKAVQTELDKLKVVRDQCNQGIDKTFNTAELVPKGLKQLEKDFITGLAGNERDYQRRQQYLKDSLKFIEQKEKVNADYKRVQDRVAAERKGLPELFAEIE